MYDYNNLYEIEERKKLIAAAMIRLRTENNKTQKEVAEAIGVKPGTYNTYEKMRNEPPAEIIVRLAYYFNVSTDDILDKGNMMKDKATREKAFMELSEQIAELYKTLESADSSSEDKEKAKAMIDKVEELKNFLENIAKNAFEE